MDKGTVTDDRQSMKEDQEWKTKLDKYPSLKKSDAQGDDYVEVCRMVDCNSLSD